MWQDLRNIGEQVCNKHAIPWLADTCSFLDGDETGNMSYFHMCFHASCWCKCCHSTFFMISMLMERCHSKHLVLRNSATALRLVDFWLKECQDSEPRGPGNRITLEVWKKLARFHPPESQAPRVQPQKMVPFLGGAREASQHGRMDYWNDDGFCRKCGW